jgi:6-phosphogluconolactonase (cycloisomerase 2 family)
MANLYNIRRANLLAGLSAAAVACAALGAAPALAAQPEATIYVSSNEAANQILIFNYSKADGLVAAGAVATGGAGIGGGAPFLESQGGVAISKDGHWLFAVNAGSNQISAFFVDGDNVVLTDTISSGGFTPVSVATSGDLVYVLNGGCPDAPVPTTGCPASGDIAANIAGFRILEDGTLLPIAGSKQALSTTNPAPADIAFDQDGDTLAVSEKATNTVDLFPIALDGVAQAPSFVASHGHTPFGVAFARHDLLLVAESFGTGVGTRTGAIGAVSSYALDDTDQEALSLITPSLSIGVGGVGPCWVTVTPDQKFAYTANLGGGTIQAFSIARDGELTLLPPNPAADTGITSLTTDLTVSNNGKLLFAVTAGAKTVNAFSIDKQDGSLTLTSQAAIPGSAVGVAVATH